MFDVIENETNLDGLSVKTVSVNSSDRLNERRSTRWGCGGWSISLSCEDMCLNVGRLTLFFALVIGRLWGLLSGVHELYCTLQLMLLVRITIKIRAVLRENPRLLL